MIFEAAEDWIEPVAEMIFHMVAKFFHGIEFRFVGGQGQQLDVCGQAGIISRDVESGLVSYNA